MSIKHLKNKAIVGVLWNSIERFATTIVQFVTGIILARLLTPEDFGLIGVLSIFIALSQVFIDSGMGSGLIQKQNRADIDFSTVFVFNLVISTFCYTLLFIGAPYLADFYKLPELLLLTRILGLGIIINALNIVQRTKLEIDVNFKKLAKINIIALFFGGVFGIGAALLDFGVWSLVIQNIVIALLTLIGFWFIGNWKLSLIFSKESFNNLFRYGSKLLVSGLYGKSLQEVYNLVIGKVYSAGELGFFTQAKKLGDISIGVLSSVIQKVSFPILSSLQDDKEKMHSVYSRMIKLTGFIAFPTMVLFSIMAEPIVAVLLGYKWLAVAPLLKWLCIARMLFPVSLINMNILNANGRSDLFLKVDLFKFPFVLASLIITIPISLEAVAIGQALVSISAFFINAYLPGKLYNYGAFKQLWDMKKTIISSMVMALIVYFVLPVFDHNLLKVIIGFLIGFFIFISMNFMLKSNELKEVKFILKK